MFFRILLLIFVLNVVFSSAKSVNENDVENHSGNAPFFELPCMAVGGVCARSVACPKGTKVIKRGLCPVQQDLGMECCRATKEVTCMSKGGECLSQSTFKCPRQLHVGVTTDCTERQVCCLYVK